MRCLLDTHVFLWALTAPKKISVRVVKVIEDPAHELFLSSVSIWEAAIKLHSGRLDLQGRTAVDLLNEAHKMNVQLISLEPDDAATVGNLTESAHFDPFDRMLIWQAIRRKLTLISGDRAFRKFTADGLKLLW